jgi:hypothetical protein
MLLCRASCAQDAVQLPEALGPGDHERTLAMGLWKRTYKGGFLCACRPRDRN